MSTKQVMKQEMNVASRTASLVFYDFVKPYPHLCKYFKAIRGYVISSHLYL